MTRNAPASGYVSAAERRALGNAFTNDDLFRVGLALVPVDSESLGVDTFHVDDGIGVCGAGRERRRHKQ